MNTDIAYSQTNRRNRYRYMNGIRKITHHQATKYCGLASLGSAQIRMKEGNAFYAGMAHCGRIWLCPNCAARVGVKRAAEVAEVLRLHRANGGIALFVTMTIRHDKLTKLEDMLTAIGLANDSFFRHKTWAKWKTRNAHVGHIRSFEITPGGTTGSAHPHIHLLILLNRPSISAEEIITSMYELGAIWARFIGRENPSLTPMIPNGFRIEQADLDDGDKLAWYATKTACESTAGELVRSDRKNTYGSYWNVAIEASRGDKQALAMWYEYEECTFNRRKLTWSRGLRASFGLVKEKTDKELAAEDDVNGELVVELSEEEARLIRNKAEILKIKMLEMAELNGADGVYFFLERIKRATVLLFTEEQACRWLKTNQDFLRMTPNDEYF